MNKSSQHYILLYFTPSSLIFWCQGQHKCTESFGWIGKYFMRGPLTHIHRVIHRTTVSSGVLVTHIGTLLLSCIVLSSFSKFFAHCFWLHLHRLLWEQLQTSSRIFVVSDRFNSVQMDVCKSTIKFYVIFVCWNQYTTGNTPVVHCYWQINGLTHNHVCKNKLYNLK